MKLVSALAKTFKRDGQRTSEFLAELKALTTADKQDLANWFRAEGTEIEDYVE